MVENLGHSISQSADLLCTELGWDRARYLKASSYQHNCPPPPSPYLLHFCRQSPFLLSIRVVSNINKMQCKQNLPRGSHSKSIPFTFKCSLVSDIISGQFLSRKGKNHQTVSSSVLTLQLVRNIIIQSIEITDDYCRNTNQDNRNNISSFPCTERRHTLRMDSGEWLDDLWNIY